MHIVVPEAPDVANRMDTRFGHNEPIVRNIFEQSNRRLDIRYKTLEIPVINSDQWRS